MTQTQPSPVAQVNITGYRLVPPEDLLANPLNARRHPNAQREAMRASLRALGWIAPVLQSVRSGALLDGHLRVEEALSAGVPLVPVMDVDVTTEQEALALATFDPIAALASYDREALDALLREVDTGEAALQQLLADVAKGAGLEYGSTGEPVDVPAQLDRAAELQSQWGTERGQLWIIPSATVPGQLHRLLCGDSTSAADVARLMDGQRANMVFADPPYGIEIVATNESVGGGEAYNIPFGGRKSKGLGSVGGAKPFGKEPVRGTVGASNVVEVGKYLPVRGDDTTDTAVAAYRLCAELWPQAVQVWWGGNYYANALPPSSCWLVWDKQNTGNFADCELAWTNQASAVRIFRHQWNGMLRESERGRRLHPTQKPAALAAWVFEHYGHEGDIVCDPFAGAGMALVAAEQTKRVCCAIEYEAAYLGVILQRLADLGLRPERADG